MARSMLPNIPRTIRDDLGYREVIIPSVRHSAQDMAQALYDTRPDIFPVKRVITYPVGVRQPVLHGSVKLPGSPSRQYFRIGSSDAGLEIASDHPLVIDGLAKVIRGLEK